MNTLEISNLSKNFGNNKVLDQLSLSVEDGSIFGFIGPNGAGKTTTMKIILGLLNADSGNVRICGEDVKYGENSTNRFVGYLPDVPSFYGYMKPMEYLNLCGEIAGLDKALIESRSLELIEMVGLKDVNRKISGFSRGMKQRLGIAQALITKPKLLILDEPTSALDPAGRKDILDILKAVKGETTIIFSTHILYDVETICDKVAVLNGGKIVLTGSLDEIKQNYKHNILHVEFSDIANAEKLFSLIKNEDFYVEFVNNAVIIKSNHLAKCEQKILSVLLENDLFPNKLEVVEPTLENLFLEVIQ